MRWPGVIEAALFDLDDTLYPESSYVESGFRAVSASLAARFGLDRERLSGRMRELLQSEGRGRIFDRVLEENGLAGRVEVPALVSLYRLHTPEISFFPDVTGVLTRLRHAGKKLGLVTDGTLCMQQNKVAALGVDRYMDAVVYCDSLGRECWKPHPAGFRKAAEMLGVEPDLCAFIGNDPAKDFPAPLTLGMQTIHLDRGRGAARNCCSAHLHVSRMEELLQPLGVR